MVGSVLMERMRAEGDFELIPEPVFFTTSQAGEPGPDVGQGARPLLDAGAIEVLRGLDCIVTCQGGDYTKDVYPRLRAAAGTAIGSTRPRPCAWSPGPPSSSTR